MKYYILAAAMAAMTLAGTSCKRARTSADSTANVQVSKAEATGAVTVTEFPGRVKASEEVNISFKLSGTLQRVFVKEGNHVTKGQVLAQLDPRDYQVQLDAVEAEYQSVKAEAERIIDLYKDSVATAAAYDKARFGLQQISAKYQNAKDQLADTKVRAPFDGYVQECLFDTPTVIGAGTPVIILVSSKIPEIEINIPAVTYIHRYDIVSLETSFDFAGEGTIPLGLVSVTPKANANQLYTVRLSLPAGINPMPSPGMSAMVQVGQRISDNDMVRIPASALFEKDGRSQVWIYSEDGSVRQREVQVRSLHVSGSAVIASGLEPGENVVSSGVHSLKDGQKVKLMGAPSSTNIGGLL